MARRRKGQRVDGWLVVDKPAGVGSTSVVSKARWAFRAQKAGHTGTLDPAATGVLTIAFGEATKAVSLVMDSRKSYDFTVRFGAATSTDDAEGEVIATSAARPATENIEAALAGFVGVIQQRPPAVSAIKVDGRRAYDLARAGDAPELPARAITVHSIVLLERPDPDHARFRMMCGKGGYVRSIARDLGAQLGCLGHVVALRRTQSGPFAISDAISFEKLDELRDTGAVDAHLLPLSRGLDDIPALDVDEGGAALIRSGRSAPLKGAAASAPLRYGSPIWAALHGAPVAIGVAAAGVFKPTRVFLPAETLAPETDTAEDAV